MAAAPAVVLRSASSGWVVPVPRTSSQPASARLMQILKGCQYVPIFMYSSIYYHQSSCIHVVLSMTYQWQWGVDQSTDRWRASWRRRNSSDVSSAVIAWRLGQPTREAQKLHDEDATNLRCLMFVKNVTMMICVNTHSKQKKLIWTKKQLTLWVFACALFTLGMFFSCRKNCWNIWN